ncbi:DUF1761 domain-containing protein [Tepidamorphus sp. 3E244]|uniref:DUF1761 domain-containing protein n=1 Tax=Tepidamorphus sp. 3E244 TaxID=3385498 RepID=UPI0038FBFAE9
MTFAGINYLSVFLAAVAGFITGAAWYTVLGRQWMAALSKSKDEMKPSPLPFVLSFVGELLMAFVLAGMIGHLGEVTLRNGIISGAFVWAGFILTTVVINNAYQGSRWALPVIDAGHWLAVLLVMGAVIGFMGV